MSKHRSFLFSAMVVSSALAACSPSGSAGPGGPSGSNGGTSNGAGGGFSFGGDSTGSGNGPGFITVSPPAHLSDAQTCGGQAYKGKLLPSNILFVQDRSGSMNCNLPPETGSAACEANPVAANKADPTKWSVISSSMSGAIDSLAKLPNTAVGLSFFSNDDLCGVQSTPSVPLAVLSPSQVGALKNAYANVTPSGGTPIVGAIVLGYKYLHEVAEARGNRFVVLITDGSDSCLGHNDSGFPGYSTEPGTPADPVGDLFNTELPNAISVNIRTFVIGVPGSETNLGFLSKLAYEGGTASSATCDHTSANPAPGTSCHLDMTQSTNLAGDLSSALQSITGTAALTCQFAVPTASSGQTVDTSNLNVDYLQGGKSSSTVQLGYDQSCATANSWQYVDSTKTKVNLCKDVCTQVLADNAAEVDLAVGCPTIVH